MDTKTWSEKPQDTFSQGVRGSQCSKIPKDEAAYLSLLSIPEVTLAPCPHSESHFWEQYPWEYSRGVVVGLPSCGSGSGLASTGEEAAGVHSSNPKLWYLRIASFVPGTLTGHIQVHANLHHHHPRAPSNWEMSFAHLYGCKHTHSRTHASTRPLVETNVTLANDLS